MRQATAGKALALEFRICDKHVGRGLIRVPWSMRIPFASPSARIHRHNPFWSYARHVPTGFVESKAEARTRVVERLLENLARTPEGGEMDLSPLKDDQRASGIVYGSNPLQNMFDLVREYTRRHAEHAFYGKWGGGRLELEGKGFAFYAEDETDAASFIERMTCVARDLRVPIEILHRHGIVAYQGFVTIDRTLKSVVRDVAGFRDCLEGLVGYPHVHEEVFTER